MGPPYTHPCRLTSCMHISISVPSFIASRQVSLSQEPRISDRETKPPELTGTFQSIRYQILKRELEQCKQAIPIAGLWLQDVYKAEEELFEILKEGQDIPGLTAVRPTTDLRSSMSKRKIRECPICKKKFTRPWSCKQHLEKNSCIRRAKGRRPQPEAVGRGRL